MKNPSLLAAMTLTLPNVFLSDAVYAANDTNRESCDGKWDLIVDTRVPVGDLISERGLWLPAKFSFDRVLAGCASEVTLKQPLSGKFVLKGKGSNHQYLIKNASRQDLPLLEDEWYVLLLNGRQKQDFWIYLPNGGEMPAGGIQVRSVLPFQV